jgi:hypothetical protein
VENARLMLASMAEGLRVAGADRSTVVPLNLECATHASGAKGVAGSLEDVDMTDEGGN